MLKDELTRLLEQTRAETLEAREQALRDLGRSDGGIEVIATLRSALLEPFGTVRVAAADTLMVLDDLAAGHVILEGLRSHNVGVRFATLTAIRSYTGRRMNGGWLQMHKTAEGTVLDRRATRIIRVLIRLCEDPDDRLRQEAAAALAAILERVRHTREQGEVVAVRGLQEELLNGAVEDDDDDGGGWSGSTFDPTAEAVSPLEREVSWVIEQAQVPSTRERFAEVTLFRDGEEDAELETLPDGEPLCAGEWYVLRAAIREAPQGVPLRTGKRKPFPTLAGEALELLAVAEGDGFEIEEPVQSLDLPAAGDSTRDAYFRIRPTQALPASASIRIRIYYRLNLLESLVFNAQVLPRFGEAPAEPGEAPYSIRQERLEQSYQELQGVEAKALHVEVSKQGTNYRFHFAIVDERRVERIAFSGTARIQASDLEDDLVRIRGLWDAIATSHTLTTSLKGDEDFFIGQLRDLATAGGNLWTRLFRQEANSSMSRIGDWLTKNPLPPGVAIQVSTTDEASDFVFPWALLYDRGIPEKVYELPDPEGFWGLRYCIEQRMPISRRYGSPGTPSGAPLFLSFFRNQRLKNVDLQDSYFQALADTHPGVLTVSHPALEVADPCYRLLQECEAQLLYFYTHGYTRQRKTDSSATGLVSQTQLVESVGRMIAALPEGSVLRASLAQLQDGWREGSADADRSWIELTQGRLYLDTLYQRVAQLVSRPIVFLNMCESAQVTPFQSQSFSHFFLDRGAKAVLGTECCMTTEFAHPFAKDVIDRMVDGATIGEAIRASRSHFIRENSNPLGLAYSLWGTGAARFVKQSDTATQKEPLP
jgi:hypothetical protein